VRLRSRRSRRRVLIIVQNLPVPFDRRVWLEARALRDAGFAVSVVCPKASGDPAFQEIEGIRVRKYAPPPPTHGTLSYAWEFLYCWLRTSVLVFRAAAREGFDVIQACNPPDTYWALAALFKPFGKRFVFDQHDLCPEVYVSRFPSGSRFVKRALLLLERATYRLADHVIATNESYRKTAMRRGGLPPDRVTVVRTGPDPERLTRGEPAPAWRGGRRYLVAYLGVMGPQDGVDLALRAAARLVRSGRDDVRFVFIGSGDSYDELVTLADELGIADDVTFTGRVPDETVFEIFSTSDVGLSPDPLNPLNDVSTMNKTMEYMAFELPVVAFDLRETRVSAGPAAVYVEPNDTDLFATAIVELLDDPDRRQEMGRLGRERVERELAWRHQAPRYVGVYASLLSAKASAAKAAKRASNTSP
jgi:glycosyltransferase involved in cell wall biosynthesis